MSSRATGHVLVVAATAIGLLGLTPGAFATPDYEVFDAKDGWICGADEGLVPNHCLNVTSHGKTLNIKVFPPDLRGPQESASTSPRADTRPCPHDSGSDDGTWWEYAEGFWVCHHSGTQPAG